MKKLFMVFILLLVGLLFARPPNAVDDNKKVQRLYFDAGMSFNTTSLNFTRPVSSDSFHGKEIMHLNNYSINNLNARLGIRVNDRFILVSEYQTIDIRENFYFNWSFIVTFYEEMNVGPIKYYGGGFIFYPHQRFQLGATVGKPVMPFNTHNDKGGGISGDDLLGLGYNLSFAYDMPIKNMGLLVGCSFFETYTKAVSRAIHPRLPTSNKYSVGLFTKIRY